MSAETRLVELGITLPKPTTPGGTYAVWRLGGGLLFLSGVGPRRPDGSYVTGQVGGAVSLEQAVEAARLCGLCLLGNMRAALGSLDRVEGILKVFGMVNAVAGFVRHPAVIDGCTNLFVELFGDAGRPARSAVGMAGLPFDISVEIEAVAQIRA